MEGTNGADISGAEKHIDDGDDTAGAAGGAGLTG